MDFNTRKKMRRSKDSAESMEPFEQDLVSTVDERLFAVNFPPGLDAAFAVAIFELGLKHSSPKILMVSKTLTYLFSSFLLTASNGYLFLCSL
jgi:hypothetical protein